MVLGRLIGHTRRGIDVRFHWNGHELGRTEGVDVAADCAF